MDISVLNPDELKALIKAAEDYTSQSNIDSDALIISMKTNQKTDVSSAIETDTSS